MQKQRLKVKTALLGNCVLGCTLLQISPLAALQTGDEPSGAAPSKDQIIVTARKRQESLQTVPLSMTAVTASTIENRNIEDVDEFAAIVPNLTTANPRSGRNQTIYTIRGMFVPTNEPNVGVFVDGVYQGSRSGLDTALFNLERIEVLRGPQNTLYGRNTFAGAINFITKKPSNDWAVLGRAVIGEFGRRDFGGAVEGPLVQDHLAFRISGLSRKHNGYFTNDLTGEKLDARESNTATFTLRATPAPSFESNLKYTFDSINDGDIARAPVRNNGGAIPLFFGALPAVDMFAFTPGFLDRTAHYASWRNFWETGQWRVESVSGYNRITTDLFRDSDYTPFRFQDSTTNEKIEEYSQELRATFNPNDTFNLLFGANYYHQTTKLDQISRFLQDNPIVILGMLPAPFTALDAFSQTETDSYSIFGQGELTPTDKLSITAGARYTWDDKSLAEESFGFPTADRDESFEGFAPQASIDYQITPDILTYVSFAIGLKTGGFNTNPLLTTPEQRFGKEEAWTYEIGAKTSWWDGRLVLNGSLFYIDWRDQQVLTATIRNQQVVQFIANASESTSKGLEVEASARLADWITLNAAYGFTDAEFDNFVEPDIPAAFGLPAEFIDHSGNTQPFAPRHTFSAGAFLEHSLTSNWEIFGGIDYQYQSRYFMSQFNVSDSGNQNIVNGNIGVRYQGLEIKAWMDNVFDERFAINGVPVPNFTIFNPVTTFEIERAPEVNAPRRFGVTVQARF